jgi:DNA-binding NarL/FixJ family response regulator
MWFLVRLQVGLRFVWGNDIIHLQDNGDGQQAERAVEKIRILLADDHAVVREGTRELLDRQADMEVVAEAGDGKEAVQLAVRERPDVVVMDFAMPELNGIEATRQIKAIVPSIAMLVLTAYDSEQYIFGFLEAGAAGYLLKDVHVDELVKAIRAVYAGESVLHPAVARKVIDRFVPPPGQQGESKTPDQLTERELDVLRLAAKGMSNREIASDLSISVRTVQTHLNNIFGKLEVGSRTEAVIHGLRRGWLTLQDTL